MNSKELKAVSRSNFSFNMAHITKFKMLPEIMNNPIY